MLENWNCQGFVNLQRNEVERKIENYLREIRWNGNKFHKGGVRLQKRIIIREEGFEGGNET